MKRLAITIIAALTLGTACTDTAEPTTAPASLGAHLFTVFARSELETYEDLAGCPLEGKESCLPFITGHATFDVMGEVCDVDGWDSGRCVASSEYPDTCEEYPLLVECHESDSSNWDVCCELQSPSRTGWYTIAAFVCCRTEGGDAHCEMGMAN